MALHTSGRVIGSGGGTPVQRRPSAVPVVILIVLLVVAAAAMLWVLRVMQVGHDPNAVLARTPLVSAARMVKPVTAKTAGDAVLAFWGSGVQETIGGAIANATGYPAAAAAHLPVSARVSADPAGGYLVRLSVLVRVAYLRKKGEVVAGWLPGTSDLKQGHLSVNAYDGHEYDFTENPKTQIAVFAFRLARSGRRLWAANADGLAAVGQNGSFNSLSL